MIERDSPLFGPHCKLETRVRDWIPLKTILVIQHHVLGLEMNYALIHILLRE